MENPYERIGLKSLIDIQGSEFVIPEYQRGYRWSKQNVADLLDDIYYFESGDNNFYCLQPLVVRRISRTQEEVLELIKKKSLNDVLTMEELQSMLKDKWEVIDGQQRLTTLLIVLSCLHDDEEKRTCMPYTIDYTTRKKCVEYLQNIWEGKQVTEEEKKANKDFYHIAEAKDKIEEWLQDDKKGTRAEKVGKLEKNLNHVKFIWFEPMAGEGIEIFIRLNIGKIPLSNAELIKALFLDSSNFNTGEEATLRLQQQEIAQQWDEIESAMHDQEFWSFICHENYEQWESPTRIDFILNLITELNQEHTGDVENGPDKSFRYFWKVYEQKRREQKENGKNGLSEDSFLGRWQEVKRIYVMFQEWFNDIHFYHYIGYLVSLDSGPRSYLLKLIREWLKDGMDKESFMNIIHQMIKETLNDSKNLDQRYGEGGAPLTKCRPLLLLHNLQTIIRQAENAKKQYDKAIFYKFPFHIYREEHWDIEHIEPRTPNDLDDPNSRKEYLVSWHDFLDDEELKIAIREYLQGDTRQEATEDRNEAFEHIISRLPKVDDILDEVEKNQIMNFVLLDSSTNRSYKNAPFPAKRRTITDKDTGKKTTFDKARDVTADGRSEAESLTRFLKSVDAASVFIPPCTKYVFLKYYTPVMTSPHAWTRTDALAYKKNIQETLKDFGVISK